MKISDIKTPQDVVKYWQECIFKLNDLTSKDVASKMLGVMSNNYFDQLYEGNDKDFMELFEIASDLEWQYDNDPVIRHQEWGRVETILGQLEDRYVQVTNHAPTMDPGHNVINDIRDVILYWRGCMAELGQIPDTSVASSMADVQEISQFDNWYNGNINDINSGKTTDGRFLELFNLVSDLETKAVYQGEARVRSWNRVKELLSGLEQKYL
jgi:hypothetical protein